MIPKLNFDRYEDGGDPVWEAELGRERYLIRRWQPGCYSAAVMRNGVTLVERGRLAGELRTLNQAKMACDRWASAVENRAALGRARRQSTLQSVQRWLSWAETHCGWCDGPIREEDWQANRCPTCGGYLDPFADAPGHSEPQA